MVLLGTLAFVVIDVGDFLEEFDVSVEVADIAPVGFVRVSSEACVTHCLEALDQRIKFKFLGGKSLGSGFVGGSFVAPCLVGGEYMNASFQMLIKR